MKALLLALSVLVSVPAFAGEYTSFGRILFQSASTFVPANKVCQLNGTLYHKTKATVAVEYCRAENSDCYIVNKPLVQPMKSTRQRCAAFSGRDEGGCHAWETVAFNQGTVKVEVFGSRHDMEEDRNPVRTYTYTVDKCRTTPGVIAH